MVPQTETTTPEPQTVTDALSDSDEESGTTTVMRDAGPALKAGAPKDYVVKRGDTLWGIANMFLRDPWLWPEIWYVNPDIHNPHRIYPGDTIHLALNQDGRMALQVVHGNLGPSARLSPLLRSADEQGPIETIPYSIIGAFLSRPGVMSRDEISAAPYVVALRDNDQVAGAGYDVYVKKVTGDQGTRYSVMHIDQPLEDPQSHRHLGYMAIYAGTAQISRPGEVARARLVDSARETLQGDVLVAESSNSTADFHPHTATAPVDGRVIAVIDNVMLAGQYEIVALNRGSADGLDRGAVLAVDSYPKEVADHCASIEGRSTCLFAHSAELPQEKEATLLVFKTYEQMSYALILQDDYPIQMFDHVRSP
ncbi:MAG TPA: LysM peptidoglycan-binding domain-containing protein [Steroidobacteraceae bacterium]|nr:LysM peptidoglycan-binding domain-containing protein [Steroidobacteraceae bacterium]